MLPHKKRGHTILIIIQKINKKKLSTAKNLTLSSASTVWKKKPSYSVSECIN